MQSNQANQKIYRSPRSQRRACGRMFSLPIEGKPSARAGKSSSCATAWCHHPQDGRFKAAQFRSAQVATGARHVEFGVLMSKGHDKLWDWFSLSYASWLTLPRVMMHEMPDEWQMQMAELLNEWDETWDSDELPEPFVTARKNSKFTKWPRWLLNYRHPDRKEIERMRPNA